MIILSAISNPTFGLFHLTVYSFYEMFFLSCPIYAFMNKTTYFVYIIHRDLIGLYIYIYIWCKLLRIHTICLRKNVGYILRDPSYVYLIKCESQSIIYEIVTVWCLR